MTASALTPRYHWRLEAHRPPSSPEELVRLVLSARGVAERGHAAFLTPSYDGALHDAALIPQCTAAVQRILRAIDHREPIAIFGDYDVDGVTSSVLLAEVLTTLGAVTRVELPHREDGYGLSVAAAQRLVPPARLLMTVDNGVSARAAVAEAIERGADVIVIDHHAVNGALPAGALVVHPGLASSRYPFASLAAVAVAWKVAGMLLAERGKAGDERFLLDLVTLGTLADSVPLVDENRALVYWGLHVLHRSRRPGLQMLAAQAGIPLESVTAEDVTYKFIPRLNAAGRLRHAGLALELLQSTDDDTARRAARDLEEVNGERRRMTDDILSETQRTLVDISHIVFVAGPWPPGLLGILASRLAEECGRPAVAVAIREGECIASIRGDGVNVIDLVRETEELLTRFGGHEGAAGFSFPRAALEEVERFFRSHGPVGVQASAPALRLDCLLPLEFATLDVARALERLEPHGPGNDRPVFLFPRVTVAESRAVGANGDHARFVFRDGNRSAAYVGVAFRWGSRQRPSLGAAVDLAAEVRVDTFRGSPRVDLRVRDLRATAPVEHVPVAA